MGYISLVEWVGQPDSDGGHRCGYCKQENTCYTNDGLWAHYMTPEDYQEPITILKLIYHVLLRYLNPYDRRYD